MYQFYPYLLALMMLCWPTNKILCQESVRSNSQYVPAVALRVKAQFPIQNAIDLRFNTKAHISGYIGIGQFSRAYVITALDFLPDDNPSQIARKQLLKDKLKNGFVLELGTAYHFVRLKDLYVGLSLQFQRFSLTATPQELVEEYDIGDNLDLLDDVLEFVETNELAQAFYETVVVKPIIRPIQLGLTIGKTFHFSKVPRLSLNLELSYSRNVTTRTELTSDSFIGRIIIGSFVNPILDEGTEDSFDEFNLPTLSLGVNYQLGKKVYGKNTRH